MKTPKIEFMDGTPWTYSDLGYNGHTALRKCCDSKVTSLAYNLAHGLTAEWALFLRVMEAAIRSGTLDTKDADTMSVSLAAWIDHTRSWLSEGDYPDRDTFVENPLDPTRRAEGPVESLYRALVGAFSLFDEGDWRGFVSYYF